MKLIIAEKRSVGEAIAAAMAQRQPVAIHSDSEEALAKTLEQLPDDMDERVRLVQTELALICRQLGALRTLAGHLAGGAKTE